MRISASKGFLKPDTTEISGDIVMVDARPEWNGWGRAKVMTAIGEVTVVGSGVQRLVPGAKAKIFGTVKDDPKFGQQFSYEDSELELPDTRHGYVQWLAARVPNVGPVRAGRLWDRFGTDIWHIVDTTPDLVLDVSGIGPEVRDSLVASYVEWLADVELYTQLSSYGFPEWLLLEIQKRWKREAIKIIHEDPYRIYYDIPRAGFQVVDCAALKAGIDKADPRRLSAAIEQSCREGESGGHTYMTHDDLTIALSKLLGGGGDVIDTAIDAAVKRDRCIYFFEEGIVQRSCLGRAESTIARFVIAHTGINLPVAVSLPVLPSGAEVDDGYDDDDDYEEGADGAY